MPKSPSELGFHEVSDNDRALTSKLIEMSRDFPMLMKLAALFEPLRSRWAKNSLSNVQHRFASDIDTWALEYSYVPTEGPRVTQSVLCFRSTKFQLPALIVDPMRMARLPDFWYDFVKRALPFLHPKSHIEIPKSHPELRKACVIYGSDADSVCEVLSEPVLSFLESHMKPGDPGLAFGANKNLPPGVQANGHQFIYHRKNVVVPAGEFEEFLEEAMQLLALIKRQ